jgi:hypothetical protein
MNIFSLLHMLHKSQDHIMFPCMSFTCYNNTYVVVSALIFIYNSVIYYIVF